MHEPGSRQKEVLDEEWAIFNKDLIVSKQYKKVKYLTPKILTEIEEVPKKMVRLDQLPRFYEQFCTMPSDVKGMTEKGNLDKSYFLFQFAL